MSLSFSIMGKKSNAKKGAQRCSGPAKLLPQTRGELTVVVDNVFKRELFGEKGRVGREVRRSRGGRAVGRSKVGRAAKGFDRL